MAPRITDFSWKLDPASLRRINVVGTSGIGKTTFSTRLASALNYPHIELDRLFWGPNWTEAPQHEFESRLLNATDQPAWVLDGNYSRIESLKLERVTAMVWLDLTFSRNLRQAVGRAWRRAWSREELWPGTGNRETFRKLLFSRDSIVLWTLQTHHRNRHRYRRMMNDPKYNSITFYQLRSPAQAQAFIDQATQVVEQAKVDNS